MNNLTKTINTRLEQLQKAIKLAEKEQKTFPAGRLRVSKSPRQTRYYKVTDSTDKTGEYLPKTAQATIKNLAQKSYNKLFLKAAYSEQKALKEFLLKYNCSPEDIYNNLIPERKKLVIPYISTNDLIAKDWQLKIFKPNPYKPENKIFDTRRGEKVRSKSEAIIADTLHEFGIPYRYEYPVKMVNGEIRYPDFMLLNLKTKQEIYLEHFGRMGDESYRKDAIEKMDLYRASGIYPGKNLIFTYETEEKPLDIKGMRRMLLELFCID